MGGVSNVLFTIVIMLEALKADKFSVTPGCKIQESQGLQLAQIKLELNKSSQCTIIPNLFPI